MNSPGTGTLYVVATPIGNLEDLSQRARTILSEADWIACEDTRRTRKLLNHFSIATPTVSYHEHNEEERAAELLDRLIGGAKIALVSDAGTPLISDPGYRLVRRCHESGVPVFPVPGPSAAVAALSVSGMPSDRFLFVGFLPKKAAARREELANIASVPATLIVFLPPHRLARSLREVEETLGDREAFLIREMTKLHETSLRGRLSQIQAQVSKETARGEYTLVVAPSDTFLNRNSPVDPAAYAHGLMETRGLNKAEAARTAARDLGLPRQDVYRMLLRKKA